MKRILIIMTALSLSINGCKEVKKKHSTRPETTRETSEEKNPIKPVLNPDNSWIEEIVLNDGIKWTANIETTNGVRDMLILIEDSKTKAAVDYKKLGEGLNGIKNTVVKECTMKGSSHDNLHVWLHPLIEKIELLQRVEKPKEGEKLTVDIQEHLEAYYDYFE